MKCKQLPELPCRIGTAPNGNIPQAILNHMQPGTLYSHADIVDALGIAPGDWTWAIQQLKEQGQVIQTGQRRGARYRASGGANV